ncbi:PREDICTED: uncharacterized protein LOC104272160, partial [Apaloderma vittatum]|uniref:uncharacterized protein LOC104272160 n=1 Tax=Apaloderma vittatum TaxID=57397 RepID=UPI00052178EA
QGIFHSVNLIDTVYQEEKLTFFSSLKKMRIINEKLMNEISSQPNDTDMVLNNDAEIIALEFGEIFKTLEMKKRQLLDDVENQRSKKEKEFQIWKKMKEAHKKTIEDFLKDCEKLVHECDPQRFLEVACVLNTRMKTQLDLMNIASSYKKPPEYTQKKMDIKPVVNEILALKLMPVNVDIVKDLPSGGNENSTKNTLFKSNIKQRQDKTNIPNAFLPVAGQEEAQADGSRICTRLMSVSEMSVFQNMSHEELRYKYYVEHQKLTSEFKTQTLPTNEKCGFVTAEALKDRSSGIPFVSLPAKANNSDKVKMGTLQRTDGFERSFSGTSNHSIPSTSTDVSETNADLKLFHERNSQKVTTPALSENFKDSVTKEQLPMQESTVISNEMNTNSSTLCSSKLAASAAVTVSDSELVDVSAERLSASAFTFSACNNSLPRFMKDTGTFSSKKKGRKYIFPRFYLGKCGHVDTVDNQDESKLRNCGPLTKTTISDASTSPNLADSEKPAFLFPFGNSERNCFSGSGVSNSFVLPFSSFFSQSKKPCDKNTSPHVRERTLSARETAECGLQKQSVLWKQKANASESLTTVAHSTSETNAAAGMYYVSKSPLRPSNCIFSFKNNCFSFPSSEFLFGSTVRNTSDSLTSSMFLSGNGTEKMEKEKMQSPDKTLLNLGQPVSSECAEPASRHSPPKCEGLVFPMNSSKRTESAEMVAESNSCSQPLCSVVLPAKYERASSARLVTATKQETKVKEEESETVAENNSFCLRREDEPESVQFRNAACFVPGMCNDPSLGGSVLTVPEAGGMRTDSDSDTEELSQTSASTDASSASEYFSVAEDKIHTRRKSET